MSADELRRAASLMRERAQAAICTYGEGHPSAGQEVRWFDAADAYCFDDTDGPHIMAWSPAVALAVADWLDKQADMSDSGNDIPAMRGRGYEESLTVARAYLGESA